MNDKILCDIFRSTKKADLYLYVPKLKGLKDVPSPLLDLFGKPELAFSLLLTKERKLAKENIELVMQSLEEKGYFLQLPRVENDEEMQRIAELNSKLSS